MLFRWLLFFLNPFSVIVIFNLVGSFFTVCSIGFSQILVDFQCLFLGGMWNISMVLSQSFIKHFIQRVVAPSSSLLPYSNSPLLSTSFPPNLCWELCSLRLPYKAPQAEWFKMTESYHLTVLESRSPTSRFGHAPSEFFSSISSFWCLVGNILSSLACRHCLFRCLHLHMEFSCASLHMAIFL